MYDLAVWSPFIYDIIDLIKPNGKEFVSVSDVVCKFCKIFE